MFKIGLAVVVGLIGMSLAYPAAEGPAKPAETPRNQVTARQGGILGAIGSALVPLVGAVLGPILTNLAQGIASAFSNDLSFTTNRNSSAEAHALLVRIPLDSPLYAALVQGQIIVPEADGLPPVGPFSATPVGKTPFNQSGQLAGKFGTHRETVSAPVEDAEPILSHNADVPEPPASSPVKRIPQRKRPEIDYV